MDRRLNGCRECFTIVLGIANEEYSKLRCPVLPGSIGHPPHICMQTLTLDYQNSTDAGVYVLSYLGYTNFTPATLINHFMLSPNPLFPHLVVLVNQPNLRTFQLIPQTASFCQHFHAGKLGSLSDVSSYPCFHPILPTSKCW